MNNLIIDATKEKIFLMLIKGKDIYSVSHENSKTNYEKLTILINDFIKKNKLKIDEISKLYVNRGPGSFAGIRNSIAIAKAIYITKILIIIVIVLMTLINRIIKSMKKYLICAIN